MNMDFTKKFWQSIYREYPHAYKAYIERPEKTDIITDFFGHYKIYVEFRDLELTKGVPMFEFYVKSKQFMINELGQSTLQNSQRKAVVVMFDVLEAQLKNQNYLNN